MKVVYEAETKEGHFQKDQRQQKTVLVRKKDQFLIAKLPQCRCVRGIVVCKLSIEVQKGQLQRQQVSGPRDPYGKMLWVQSVPSLTPPLLEKTRSWAALNLLWSPCSEHQLQWHDSLLQWKNFSNYY